MSGAHSSPQVRLADHVRACHLGGQLVFLDLLRNRYIGVGGAQLPALSTAIFGQTAADEAPEPLSNPALLKNWIDRLRQEQLLSDAPDVELLRTQPTLPEPVSCTSSDDQDLTASSVWRNLVRLWQASITTASWLRRRSLADIADRVADLRARHPGRTKNLPSDAMHFAAARYLHLRPFALTTHDRCLHDSLALIHFLATQGLFPHWVIGVRSHPFGAHSWVQSGGVVLNDVPERVRAYRPILVV